MDSKGNCKNKRKKHRRHIAYPNGVDGWIHDHVFHAGGLKQKRKKQMKAILFCVRIWLRKTKKNIEKNTPSTLS